MYIYIYIIIQELFNTIVHDWIAITLSEPKLFGLVCDVISRKYLTKIFQARLVYK